MLFQSDYWLASNQAEKKETLLDFLYTDEGIKTLVIIDTYQSNVRSILETVDLSTLDCNIQLITRTETHLLTHTNSTDAEKHTKTIYVCPALNPPTIVLLKTHSPILAIFV
jgi:hypothetical protein